MSWNVVEKNEAAMPDQTPSVIGADQSTLTEQPSPPKPQQWSLLHHLCTFLAVATLFAAAAGVFVWRQQQAARSDSNPPRFIRVVMRSVPVARPASPAPPPPQIIEVGSEIVKVAAIVTGNPRLGVINGRTVTEGDRISVRLPSQQQVTALRVVTIADGRIDLSDGSRIIRAHFTPVSTKLAVQR